MPAKDFYHDIVKEALIKDGWTITHDPLILPAGKTNVYMDLGAERMIGAEKGNEKIAVEIKSFLGKSGLNDLENALGQFFFYLNVLEEKDPERILVLAVPLTYFEGFLRDAFYTKLLTRMGVNTIIYNEIEKIIVEWKKY